MISAEELIEQLHQTGGTVCVRDPDAATRRVWRQAIHAAKSRGLIPDGHHLRYRGRDKGDLVVRLVPGEHPAERYLDKHPVPVPEQVDDRHPVVAIVGEGDAVQAMSAPARRRTLLVLHAIAVEAERRGYAIDYPRDGGAQLRLTAGDVGCSVAVTELTETRPHILTPEELKARNLYPWQRIPQEYEEAPTGELRLEADCALYGSLSRHDGQRWQIEDKIWDVFATIERAVEHRAQQRAEQERRAAEEERRRMARRKQWETAMAEATRRAVEDRRIQALDDQLAMWQRAQAVRAYANALEDRLRRATDDEDAEANRSTAEWVKWLRSYADRLDPVQQLPGLPDESAISVDHLRPYLHGLNPDGPDA